MSTFDFNFGNNIIRAKNINGNPWFVGRDIALALGYANPNAALQKVDEADRANYDARNERGELRPHVFVNEVGMYELIFGSTLTEAKTFKRWVTSEVLPQIRKTGSYVGSLTQNEQNMVMGLYEEEIRNLARTKKIKEWDIYLLIYKTIFPSGTYESLISNTERRYDGWRHRRYIKGTNKQALLYWFLTENGIVLNKYYQGQISMLLKLVEDGKQFKEISDKLYNNKGLGS